MKNFISKLSILWLPLVLIACDQNDSLTVTITNNNEQATATGAVEFVARSEQQLGELALEAERMSWVYSNFITDDTERLSATATRRFTAKQVDLAAKAARYVEIEGLDADTRRKLNLLNATQMRHSKLFLNYFEEKKLSSRLTPHLLLHLHWELHLTASKLIASAPNVNIFFHLKRIRSLKDAQNVK